MRSERHKEFLPLLVTHKDMLYQYILIMVPFQTIAEDILQDTIIILWEKFDDFTVGTSFPAWAKAIALNKVREYRRKRDFPCFDSELLELLSSENPKPQADNRLSLLQTCLGKLSKSESEVTHLRFFKEMKVVKIAESWGKTPDYVYRMLGRILRKLKQCITNGSLAEESI